LDGNVAHIKEKRNVHKAFVEKLNVGVDEEKILKWFSKN
jgi:hypothetical protein